MPRLSEELAAYMYDFDPTSTAAQDVAWVDMQGYDRFMAMVMYSLSTGAGNGPTAVRLLGNSAATGTGTDVVIVTSTEAACDAVGDWIRVEASQDDIVAASESGARYISCNIAQTSAGGECVVAYIRGGPKVGKALLTAAAYSA